MKKIYTFCFFIILVVQFSLATGWSSKFEPQKVFIENKGQFTAEPIPQRRIIAKLEPAAGLVTMFRNSGKSCSAAASNKGNVRVSRFMMLVVLGFQF